MKVLKVWVVSPSLSKEHHLGCATHLKIEEHPEGELLVLGHSPRPGGLILARLNKENDLSMERKEFIQKVAAVGLAL